MWSRNAVKSSVATMSSILVAHHPKGLYGLQMEKEKRKRPAVRAPKQHVNKKGRSEKPAVTQGRRSKFTAMSAQTVSSEDEDAATFQRQKYVPKLPLYQTLLCLPAFCARLYQQTSGDLHGCCRLLCKCCYMTKVAQHDQEPDSYVDCRKASKLDRNAATSARVQQPTATIKRRPPANGKPKNSRMDNFNSAAMDLFGTVSLDPYAFERSQD